MNQKEEKKNAKKEKERKPNGVIRFVRIISTKVKQRHVHSRMRNNLIENSRTDKYYEMTFLKTFQRVVNEHKKRIQFSELAKSFQLQWQHGCVWRFHALV